MGIVKPKDYGILGKKANFLSRLSPSEKPPPHLSARDMRLYVRAETAIPPKQPAQRPLRQDPRGYANNRSSHP